MRRLVPVLAGLLLLAGCATSPEEIELGDGIAPTVEGSDDDDAEHAAGQPADVTGGHPAATPATTVAAGSGASPAPGACLDVPRAPDDVYTVAEAGTVTITVADGTLTLGPVQPFAGWDYEVTTEEATEVEVAFVKDAEHVRLAAEVDDGEPFVEVCADDA